MSQLHDSKFTIQKYETNVVIPEYIKEKFPGPLNRATIEEFKNPVINELVYTFKTFLLTKQKSETTTETHNFPASWWEHFKEDRFPLWLLKYFPVKYIKITTTTIHKKTFICPHDNLAWNHQDVVHIMWMEGLPHEDIIC